VLPEQNGSATIDGNILINVSDNLPRYELWFDASDCGELQTQIETLPRQEKTAWDLLDLEAGILLIQDSESSLYTPEELNLDLAGFVSFNKGCYTGQEIVARMHFRGKASKRLFLATIESASPGEDLCVYDNADKALGKVFNLLPLNDTQCLGLIILKTDTPVEDSFRLGEKEANIMVKLSPFSPN